MHIQSRVITQISGKTGKQARIQKKEKKENSTNPEILGRNSQRTVIRKPTVQVRSRGRDKLVIVNAPIQASNSKLRFSVNYGTFKDCFGAGSGMSPMMSKTVTA